MKGWQQPSVARSISSPSALPRLLLAAQSARVRRHPCDGQSEGTQHRETGPYARVAVPPRQASNRNASSATRNLTVASVCEPVPSERAMVFALSTRTAVLIACLLIALYLYLSAQLYDQPTHPASFASSLPAASARSARVDAETADVVSAAPLDRVEVTPLFHASSSHPLSTTGEVLRLTSSGSELEDFLSYPLCSFTHVCVESDTLRFRWPNRTDYERNVAFVIECFDKQRQRRAQYDLCYCFYPPQLQPAALAFELLKDDASQTVTLQLQRDRKRAGRPLRKDDGAESQPLEQSLSNSAFAHSLPSAAGDSTTPVVGSVIPGSSPPIFHGHYWGVHKYVGPQHHIGHWAQRLVLFSAIFQHSMALPLPPLSGVVIQDTTSPLSPHEQAILNITLYSLLTQQDHPLLHSYLASSRALPNQIIPYEQLRAGVDAGQPVCVERLSFLKMFGVFATNNHDTMAFRAVAYKQYGITGLSHRCPPRHITLLTRDNRKILNQQEVVDYIARVYKKSVSVVQISGESTPAEQIRTFAESGLLLAPHSSQLVNVMFSHPRSAMIEIAPEYYNSDFSEYAHGMGVFFRYALGGTVPGVEVHDSMRQCLAVLNECEGDSYCMLVKRFDNVCKKREVCCKYLPGFYANMTQLQVALQHAINHLNWACGETW